MKEVVCVSGERASYTSVKGSFPLSLCQEQELIVVS